MGFLYITTLFFCFLGLMFLCFMFEQDLYPTKGTGWWYGIVGYYTLTGCMVFTSLKFLFFPEVF